MKFPLFFALALFFSGGLQAQFLMDMVDTSKATGQGLLRIYKNFDGLQISGYIQPQFQIAQEKGIETYEGTNFPERVKERFLLRRSRIRFDYYHLGQNQTPDVQVVFQFDANERGFTVRDVWGRISENRFQLFSFTTGIFARPMGFEVNYSSGSRETPERGRMSQILMKSERDLGAMISLNPRKKDHPLRWLKVDFGIFNGQGIVADGEFDNLKDFIGRVSLKPIQLQEKISLSASTSFLHGGLEHTGKYRYFTSEENGVPLVRIDSSLDNIGGRSDRDYLGADLQLKIKNKVGHTELRAETIFGDQTGTRTSSVTPIKHLDPQEGFYKRKFSGAYFYLIQNVFSPKHQLVLKYDWYDPNTKVKGNQITADNNFTAADVRYETIGLGYNYYMNDNMRLQLYHAWVKNESTALPGFEKDIRDNVFTFRWQFRF